VEASAVMLGEPIGADDRFGGESRVGRIAGDQRPGSLAHGGRYSRSRSLGPALRVEGAPSLEAALRVAVSLE